MQLKILLIRFFSLFSLIVCTRSLAFRKILGEDDYVIVGVDDCSISVEVEVEDNNCAFHMTDRPKSGKHCQSHFALLYLPQEQNSTIPPKILKLFKSGQDTVFNLEDITFPGSLTKNVTQLEFTQFLYLRRHVEGHQLSIPFDLIFGVLYNHHAGLLYILSYTNDYKMNAVVDIYYLYPENVYPLKLRYEYLTRMPIDRRIMGTYWSSDPYTGRFYCYRSEFHEMLGGMINRLYSTPFDMILTNLRQGVLGKMEQNFDLEIEKKRDFAQVTNGLVYSRSERHRLLRALHRRVHGTRCNFKFSRGSDFLFVLTGWEYCKVRDGEYANITACLEQGSDSQLLSECSNSLLWSIAIAVIANAVILLVILCVVCKYYKHEDHDHGLYMNSHPTKVRTALITPDELFEKRRLNSSVIDI